MKIGDQSVFQGGLMRCCLATLNNHADEECEGGMTLPCDYEKDDEPKMIFDTENRSGVLAWRWLNPEERVPDCGDPGPNCIEHGGRCD